MDLCVKRKLSFPASSLHMYDALLDPFPLVRQDKGAVSSPGVRLRTTPTTKSQAGRQSLLFMSETVLQASKPDAGREEWLSCVTQSSSSDNTQTLKECLRWGAVLHGTCGVLGRDVTLHGTGGACRSVQTCAGRHHTGYSIGYFSTANIFFRHIYSVPH